MKTFKLNKEAIFDSLKEEDGNIAVIFPEADEVWEDCDFSIYVMYEHKEGSDSPHSRGMSSVRKLREHLRPEGVSTGVTILYEEFNPSLINLEEEEGDIRFIQKVGD